MVYFCPESAAQNIGNGAQGRAAIRLFLIEQFAILMGTEPLGDKEPRRTERTSLTRIPSPKPCRSSAMAATKARGTGTRRTGDSL